MNVVKKILAFNGDQQWTHYLLIATDLARRKQKQTSNKAYQTQATVNICQGYDFLENPESIWLLLISVLFLLSFRPTDS